MGLNWRCIFAVRQGSDEFIPETRNGNLTILTLSGRENDEAHEIFLQLPGGCDLMVVDHYERGSAFIAESRKYSNQILLFDDVGRDPLDCDVLLNQNTSEIADQFLERCNQDVQILAGPEYAVLRPEFQDIRSISLHRRKKADQVQRILINFGASDPMNVTGAVLDLLPQTENMMTIDVILGAAAPNLDKVKRKAASLPFPVNVYAGVRDIEQKIFAADLAIGAGGVSAWERCCLGLPSIVVPLADNQMPVAESLSRSKAAWIIPTERLSDNFSKLFDLVIHDLAELRERSENASLLCDGLGANRVAGVLNAPRSVDNRKIGLRPVVAKDAAILFDWQNRPGVRDHFRNPEPPSSEEHDEWMVRKLSDPDCLFNLVLLGGIPAGLLRFDKLNDESNKNQVWEVSILIAPEYQRKGVAKGALELGRILLPNSELRAHVQPENLASASLFESSGYGQTVGQYKVSEPVWTRGSPL